ncbi:MAG: hypothetical protein ABIJ96_11130 [Elusimicrobiota bacterium]
MKANIFKLFPLFSLALALAFPPIASADPPLPEETAEANAGLPADGMTLTSDMPGFNPDSLGRFSFPPKTPDPKDPPLAMAYSKEHPAVVDKLNKWGFSASRLEYLANAEHLDIPNAPVNIDCSKTACTQDMQDLEVLSKLYPGIFRFQTDGGEPPTIVGVETADSCMLLDLGNINESFRKTWDQEQQQKQDQEAAFAAAEKEGTALANKTIAENAPKGQQPLQYGDPGFVGPPAPWDIPQNPEGNDNLWNDPSPEQVDQVLSDDQSHHQALENLANIKSTPEQTENRGAEPTAYGSGNNTPTAVSQNGGGTPDISQARAKNYNTDMTSEQQEKYRGGIQDSATKELVDPQGESVVDMKQRVSGLLSGQAESGITSPGVQLSITEAAAQGAAVSAAGCKPGQTSGECDQAAVRFLKAYHQTAIYSPDNVKACAGPGKGQIKTTTSIQKTGCREIRKSR